MKKKITVAALVACMTAILVGTSLAYFKDVDEVKNTFTVGSVEIEQIEKQLGENGAEEDYVNSGKVMLPIVNTQNVKADANFQDKIVTVKNTGKNSAYVQTFVAVPKSLADNGVLHIYDAEGLVNGWVKEDAVAEFTENSITYEVTRYRYMPILGKDLTTPSVIQGVYIDSAADLNVYDTDNDGTIDDAYFVMSGTDITGFNATGELNVYVATQAVQADGFADADAALAAAYTEHPWA